jgi:hypothetical protein
MDDTACRDFFAQPTNPYQRHYEVLRAVFLERRAPQDVAEQFGLAGRTLRQLVYEFRQHCRHSADGSPFFESGKWDGLSEHRPPNGLLRRRFLQSLTGGNSSCPRPSRYG